MDTDGGVQPRFVVLEGLDGAGTTTQAGLLTEVLRGRGLLVEPTAEPSDGPIGAVARAHVRSEVTLDPLTAALTFTADRADHLHRVIRPALAEGRWVVCDRYLLSTVAYQGTEGVDPDLVLAASRDFDVPDLTVLLDVEGASASARLEVRSASTGDGPDRYEGPELADRLRAAYLDGVERLIGAGHDVVVLDGGGSVEAVAEAVLAAVDAID